MKINYCQIEKQLGKAKIVKTYSRSFVNIMGKFHSECGVISKIFIAFETLLTRLNGLVIITLCNIKKTIAGKVQQVVKVELK